MSLGRHSQTARPRSPFRSRPHPLRSISPAQIQPFLHFLLHNYSRINTSKNFSKICISQIIKEFKLTRINTSGNKHLKPPRINTSGAKDLKSCRINTSKKGGRGVWKSACRVQALLEVRQQVANGPVETARAFRRDELYSDLRSVQRATHARGWASVEQRLVACGAVQSVARVDLELGAMVSKPVGLVGIACLCCPARLLS
jgi:hypothetical protein